MNISELLPHKAVQAVEQAEQQSSQRDKGQSVAENFKKHLDQVNQPAQAAGLDPLKARDTRDDDSFRQSVDRDATLRAQEQDEQPVRQDAGREDTRDQDNTRDEPVARDADATRHNTDRDEPRQSEDAKAEANDAASGDDSNTNERPDSDSDTAASDDNGDETATASEGQTSNADSDQNAPAAQTETNQSGDAVAAAGIAAGSGLQQTGNQQNTNNIAAQGVAADLTIEAVETGNKPDQAINLVAQNKANQQAAGANTQSASPAAAEAARQAAAQAGQAQQRNLQQNQQAAIDPALAGVDGEDGIDLTLPSLSQRSLAAEKGKAGLQNGLQQQVKTSNEGVAQGPVQTMAQKADTALNKLADPMAQGGQVRQGGQEMSQAQATTQNQSNVASSATGQQAVDSPNKVVTLSTPRGAAHMPPTQQVALHIAKGLEGGANKININLKPVELGRVEVQLEIAKDGGVMVRVTADRQETLDLLKNDSSSLKEAIEDSGLNLENEDMEFNLREDREGDLAKEETGKGDDGDDTASANDNDSGIMSPEETQAAIAQSIIDRALDITV